MTKKKTVKYIFTFGLHQVLVKVNHQKVQSHLYTLMIDLIHEMIFQYVQDHYFHHHSKIKKILKKKKKFFFNNKNLPIQESNKDEMQYLLVMMLQNYLYHYTNLNKRELIR